MFSAYSGNKLIKTFNKGERDIDISRFKRGVTITKITGTLPPSLILFDSHTSEIGQLPELPNSIKGLDVSYSRLEKLPTLPANLDSLVCAHNRIFHLPTLPTKLRRLKCNNTQLTELPTLPPNLEYLDCSFTYLKRLPALPKSLRELILWQIRTFDEPFAKITWPYTDYGYGPQNYDMRSITGEKLETLHLQIDRILTEEKMLFLEDAEELFNTDKDIITPDLQGLPNEIQARIASFITAKNGTVKNQWNRLKNNVRRIDEVVPRTPAGGRVSNKRGQKTRKMNKL
jgi:hypothetical protein